MDRPFKRIKDNLACLAEQRLTPQRALLLNILYEGEYLTVNELYRRANIIKPHINLSTIYRNLRLFLRKGLIDELRLTKSNTRYFIARNRNKPYHIVCLKCGRILDFNNPLIEELKKVVEDETGMIITNVLLSMDGYCMRCKAVHKNF